MRTISADEVDAILSMPVLIDALAAAFRSDITVPPRHHHAVHRTPSGGTLLLMPAWTGAGVTPSYLGTKALTLFPSNAAHQLPTVLGSYLLCDGCTGVPHAVIDGTRLTLWRTAAASALAGRYLARPDTRTMLMVGAGALAPFMVRAHAAVHALERIVVWNHRFDAARQLADTLQGEGLPASPVQDLALAVAQADLVSCATRSMEPLVRGVWLRAGTHVDCVGAYMPTMRETDDEVIVRSQLFCDTRAAAIAEAGDLAQPIASGLIQESDVQADLFDLSRGRHPGRRAPQEITFFKSVGTAVEDLAAAVLVWESLAASDEGER